MWRYKSIGLHSTQFLARKCSSYHYCGQLQLVSNLPIKFPNFVWEFLTGVIVTYELQMWSNFRVVRILKSLWLVLIGYEKFFFASFLTILFPVAGHSYETRVGDAFVIASNDALLSCSLPSFASEYLSITSWVTSEGLQISHSDTNGNVSTPTSQLL